MPNWPRNSCRANPSSSRLELRPMVASSSCTCASVRPMPVSVIVRPLSPSGGDRDVGGRVGVERAAGGDRVDGVLQQLADVHPRARVEVVAEQVDHAAQVDLEAPVLAHRSHYDKGPLPGRNREGVVT